jgi:hypothetical protein
VEIALWMWSGIIDFSREEQIINICKIAGFLGSKGKLYLDLPRQGTKTMATHQDDKHLVLETSFGKLFCYMPGYEDLEEYAFRAGFANLTSQDYITSTKKERTIFTFHK